MIEEKYETSDDNEVEYQTVRMYSEYKEGTIGMLKMNIKLPTPSTYAGADEQKGTIGTINDPDEEKYEERNEETEEYYDDYNDEDVKYVVEMFNK
eukprot:2623819-Amphidinium_carterae.2